MTTRDAIDAFLAQRRIAAVGVSRNPADFTRQLVKEFRRRGYQVVPVNPNATAIDDQACFARLQDVQPAVEAALLFTPPAVTDSVVRDCAHAGVRLVWMHRGGGLGSVSPSAVAFCRSQGISVIEGECPMMFLPDSGFIHGLHALIKKIAGRYPH